MQTPVIGKCEDNRGVENASPHFYLLRHHIFFYIKFLVFCSLVTDEIRILCGKNKGILQKIMIFNQMETYRKNASIL